MSGWHTKKLALSLCEAYGPTVHSVYYDPHSESDKEKLLKTAEDRYLETKWRDRRKQPTPFFGPEPRAKASPGDDQTLSNLDIVLVNPTSGLEILIEVEEGNVPPKHIIGDLLNIFLADGVSIKGVDNYPLTSVLYIVALKRSTDKMKEKARHIHRELAKQPIISKQRRIALRLLVESDINKLCTRVQHLVDIRMRIRDTVHNHVGHLIQLGGKKSSRRIKELRKGRLAGRRCQSRCLQTRLRSGA